MSIRYRTMQPGDVGACVDIVASVPAARLRYGQSIGDLDPAWLRLLGCAAKTAMVLEQVAGSRSVLCGFGISVFVRDEFIRELKARPFWFGPELARRLRAGTSPLLTEREMAEANSRGGMNVLVWEGRVCPGFESNSDVYRKMTSSFMEAHRGYLWKEMIFHEMETVDRFLLTLQVGGLLWDPGAGRYTDKVEQADAARLLQSPHVLGLTRELEMQRPGSWIGAIFEYEPPRFGFTRSEQRLLMAALDGRTDQQLSNELDISLFTIKKMWRQIYERVGAHSRELIPAYSEGHTGNGASERGPEKKQRLIGYLRDHPEELRPVSRKLLPSSDSPTQTVGAP